MILDVETGADFYKYYRHRHIKGKDGRVWYLERDTERHHPEYNYLEFSVTNKDDKWERMNVAFVQTPDLMLFGLPRLGCIELNNELLYGAYLSTREGSRGLDTSRIIWTSFNAYELKEWGLVPFTDRGEWGHGKMPVKDIKKILFPRRYVLGDALKILRDPDTNKLAVSLQGSPDGCWGLYLAATSKVDELSLTYKTYVVGTILPDDTFVRGPACPDEMIRIININFPELQVDKTP